MSKPVIDNVVVCDICHKQFPISSEYLLEEHVTLHKDSGEEREVDLTYLKCPLCGKRYPVIMDDETTLPILKDLRTAAFQCMKHVSHTGKVPKKLEEKYKNLNWKLDFKRQELAKKFNGSLYQSEGETIQLDYRYHAR